MISQPVAIFLLVLAIILLGPVVFRRLKIPPIVGLIVAGMAVGPDGFDLLQRDDSFVIFGEVGILYIMFQAAVEIDMFHLKRQYRKGVAFGLMSFALPMLAGVFGARYAFGVGWDSAVLIASMYASHTLVSYPVVSRFGIQNSRGAVIAVCGTIVAVMLALLCLAGVVQVRAAGEFRISLLARLIVFTVIYCIIIGYGFPFITRRFFRSNLDPVTQFIFILALVFVASLLAQFIGLEAILGAFYAGLVLNRMIPARSVLMKNIRFVGDSLFIPYFLIGVGMLINVRVIFQSWSVIWVAVNMSVIALATKLMAAYATKFMFSLPSSETRLMFGLSSGKAAATIAAVMIGYSYGMLSEDVMNGAVVMILICCIVASIVTESAARRIRMNWTSKELENDGPKKVEYAHQLVSVSNPLTSEALMRLALFMRSPRNHNPITVLFVRTDQDSRTRSLGQAAMQRAASIAEEMSVDVRRLERYDINIASAQSSAAVEQEATDIIIGMHRKTNVVDTFFGTVIEQLVRATKRMVIISRFFTPVDTLSRIVVKVPQKAEYETGFHEWVVRLVSLASNIEASITFLTYIETQDFIKSAIIESGIEADVKFEVIGSFDDFILLTGDIGDEDLLAVVTARKGSISYSSEFETLPGYLNRYFNRHNLLIVYPRQF